VGPKAARYFGDSISETLLMNLSFSGAVPTAVDTIGRMVYWYSASDNLIYRQSLHGESTQVHN